MKVELTKLGCSPIASDIKILRRIDQSSTRMVEKSAQDLLIVPNLSGLSVLAFYHSY